MLELARQKNDYVRSEISKSDAIEYFEQKGDEYKLELLDKLEDGSITFYKQGGFTDLCRGPHIPNTGIIKAVKLTKVSGAYWQNNEENNVMTRVYGISFPKAKELTEYLEMIEEAKKRDHRKLGKELELFMFSEKVGAGLPIWLPKGTALRNRLQVRIFGLVRNKREHLYLLEYALLLTGHFHALSENLQNQYVLH